MSEKKNIFVVTWYKSENFGTCLQAYATYALLGKEHNILFLNRRTYYPLTKSLQVVKKGIGKLVINVRHHVVKKHEIYVEEGQCIKKEKIESYAVKNYKSFSIKSKKDISYIDDWADCYLVGSDQMWNPWMLRPHYLLDFVPKRSITPKYSYATSFGVENIPKCKKRTYKKYLSRFTQITVREPRAAELVDEIAGRKAAVVLDPTLLLSQADWRKFSGESNTCKQYGLNNDYIICYFIGAPEFNYMEIVKSMASELGLKVVLLPMKNKDFTETDVIIIADACPYDFVSLIDNAKLVCTDSFHAVVFSFLMTTAFYKFPRFKEGDKYSQEARVLNIIYKFKLSDSFWDDSLVMDDVRKHMNCDYEPGYVVLDQEKERSKSILFNMVRGDQEVYSYEADK